MALTEKLSAIGNAIREKNGTTDLIPLADMPQAILDIVSGGGGITYTNIVYNEDDTIELTDTDGIVHTMECSYEDGKLVSVKYDRKSVALKYDGDVLVKVGETAVDMANVQTSVVEALDHTVTFMVDGEPYEVVSVKDGNSVNAPTTPTKAGYKFNRWNDSDNNYQEFPFVPTTDMNINAFFTQFTKAENLIHHFGFNTTEFDSIAITVRASDGFINMIHIFKDENVTISSTKAVFLTPLYRGDGFGNVPNPYNNADNVVNFLLTKDLAFNYQSSGESSKLIPADNSSEYLFTNSKKILNAFNSNRLIDIN